MLILAALPLTLIYSSTGNSREDVALRTDEPQVVWKSKAVLDSRVRCLSLTP